MKIGPINIRFPTVLYFIAVVATAIALSILWRKNEDVRAESFYRESIFRALNDNRADVMTSGVDACRFLIKLRPDRINPHLYLGTLLLKQNQPGEAHRVFEKAAQLSAASSEELAWALTGAGVAQFDTLSKGNLVQAREEAEKYFLRAKNWNENSADALANLALVQPWETAAKALAESERYCKLALATPSPGSLATQQNLHHLQGMLLFQSGKPVEAIAAFERAHALCPEWDAPLEGVRMAVLACVLREDIDAKTRRDLLEKTEREMAQYGEHQSLALNVLAAGWVLLKSSPEDAAGLFVHAQNLLKTAIQKDSSDGQAYLNQAGLIEDRIIALGKQLKALVSGINGETPVANPWTASYDDKAKPSPGDKSILIDIRALLVSEDELWRQYLEKAAGQVPQKINGKLRQLACIRRLGWLTAKEDPQHKILLDRALTAANELLSLDVSNGNFHFLLGQILRERNEFPDAFKAFQMAESKGLKTPELSMLLNVLGKKCEIVDVWPNSTRRFFGSVPLVGVSLKTLVPIKNAGMKINGKTVAPIIAGTQIFYLPANDELKDGEQNVAISVSDSSGQIIEFPEFSFSADKKPPTWKFSQEIVGSQPVWTITLWDETGIDFNSLKINLATVKSNTIVNADLIKNGKYNSAMTKINIKSGTNVNLMPFKLCASLDLTPGEYSLAISVQDYEGNGLVDKKAITLK